MSEHAPVLKSVYGSGWSLAKKAMLAQVVMPEKYVFTVIARPLLIPTAAELAAGNAPSSRLQPLRITQRRSFKTFVPLLLTVKPPATPLENSSSAAHVLAVRWRNWNVAIATNGKG